MIKKLFQKPAIQWPTKFQQKLELVSDENLVAFYGSELPAPILPFQRLNLSRWISKRRGSIPKNTTLLLSV